MINNGSLIDRRHYNEEISFSQVGQGLAVLFIVRIYLLPIISVWGNLWGQEDSISVLREFLLWLRRPALEIRRWGGAKWMVQTCNCFCYFGAGLALGNKFKMLKGKRFQPKKRRKKRPKGGFLPFIEGQWIYVPSGPLPRSSYKGLWGKGDPRGRTVRLELSLARKESS